MARSFFSRLLRPRRLLSKKEEALLHPETQPIQWLMDHNYEQLIEKRLAFMRETSDQALWKAFWELEFPRLMKRSIQKNQPHMTMLLFQGKPQALPLPDTTLSWWIEALHTEPDYGSQWRKEEQQAWIKELQQNPQKTTPKIWELLGKSVSHTLQLSRWCNFTDPEISGERLLEGLWKKGCQQIDRAELLIRSRLSIETNKQNNTNRQTSACMQWAMECQPTETKKQAVADVITSCLREHACDYDSNQDPSWYAMANVIQAGGADTEEFQQLFDLQLNRLRFDKKYFRITNSLKGLALPARLQVSEENAIQWAQETSKYWNSPDDISSLTEMVAFFQTLKMSGAVSEKNNAAFHSTLIDAVPDVYSRIEGLLQTHGNPQSQFSISLTNLSNQIRATHLERELPEPSMPSSTVSFKPRF